MGPTSSVLRSSTTDNHAARYSHHLVAIRDVRLIAAGSPAEIVNPALVRRVIDLDCHVQPDPVTVRPS